MFVTKRSLSDACKSVAKQLDDVFLSLRISVVRGTVSELTVDLQTVNHKIRTLETRMGRIKEKQDETKEGVARLLLSTLDLENKFADLIQDSSSSASRPSIGHQKLASTSRTTSLPLALEASFPSTSNGSYEVKKLRRSTTTRSGQKEYQVTSAAVDNNNNLRVLNSNHITEITEKPPGPVLPEVDDIKSHFELRCRIIGRIPFPMSNGP
ncbi:uncharacterized protein LOC130808768 isoform X2 [Amaranthus tricolor]|nr:uncharacterized protein LOC130808768 isoform X2 [Amaranthus tricolor]